MGLQMIWIVVFVVVIACIFLPQLWTKRILKKYSSARPDLPGTGGELAMHLIKQFDLDVKLETTEQGDHYDPISKTVRLSSDNFNTKSLTAVATAAHEVGHAIQHQNRMTLLLLRAPLAKGAFYIEKIAQLAVISTPILLGLLPGAARISIAVAIIGMLASTLVHFVTLPVEFNASFSKALPILKNGEYLAKKDYQASRKILLACALTYVSAALASLLNIWRWLSFFKR
ncbi:MAG: Zn-dependent membrane protease YugP [Psychrobacter glaciei]|jgi:Zn-dependent membrane protease YugP